MAELDAGLAAPRRGAGIDWPHMGAGFIWLAIALRHDATQGAFLSAFVPAHEIVGAMVAAEVVVALALIVVAVRSAVDHSRLRRALVFSVSACYGLAVFVPAIRRELAATDPRLEVDRQLSTALRYLAAEEEEARLANGRYVNLEELPTSHLNARDSLRIDAVITDSTWGFVARSLRRDRWCSLVSHQEEVPTSMRDGTAGEPRCADGDNAATSLRPRVHPLGNTQTVERRDGVVGDWWPQYRHDAEKRAATAAVHARDEWTQQIFAPIRSTVSLAAGLVIAGAHGTGDLFALESATGRVAWRNRAPNWIHQDPAIRDSTVVLGFGDNRSFRTASGELEAGFGPSGAMAVDLQSGRRRWLANERGSVMTSPVIAGERVIYATGDGKLVARDILSGRLLWRRELPGRPVMGSPALSEGVVFTSLEPRTVCAFTVASGVQRWCTSFGSEHVYVGHAAPTVSGGRVFITSLPDSAGWQMLRDRSWAARLSWLRERVLGSQPAHYGEQVLWSLSAVNGEVEWSTQLGGGHAPFGHTAGTPIADGAHIFVVSPIAQSVIALDAASGRVLWRVPGPRRVRGPPALYGRFLIVADVGGEVRAHDRASGAALCRGTILEGVDRAGPVIAGNSAFFGGLRGAVMHVRLDALLSRCTR